MPLMFFKRVALDIGDSCSEIRRFGVGIFNKKWLCARAYFLFSEKKPAMLLLGRIERTGAAVLMLQPLVL
jgi:hypothetical protein